MRLLPLFKTCLRRRSRSVHPDSKVHRIVTNNQLLRVSFEPFLVLLVFKCLNVTGPFVAADDKHEPADKDWVTMAVRRRTPELYPFGWSLDEQLLPEYHLR